MNEEHMVLDLTEVREGGRLQRVREILKNSLLLYKRLRYVCYWTLRDQVSPKTPNSPNEQLLSGKYLPTN